MKTKWPKREIDKVPLAERLLYYLPRMLSKQLLQLLILFGASYVFKVYGPYSLETATGFMRSVYQAVVSYYFVFAVGGTAILAHTIWGSLFADREELELIIAPSRKPKPKKPPRGRSRPIYQPKFDQRPNNLTLKEEIKLRFELQKIPIAERFFYYFPRIIIVDIPYFVLPFMLKLLIEVYGYPVYLKTSPGFLQDCVVFIIRNRHYFLWWGYLRVTLTLLRPFIYGRRILDYMIATKEEKREIDEYEDKQLEESLEEIKRDIFGSDN